MDLKRCTAAGDRMNGALAVLLRRQHISFITSVAVHNAVLIPTLLYSSETCVLQKTYERKSNAMEIQSLRRICEVSLGDLIRNEKIYRICVVVEVYK